MLHSIFWLTMQPQSHLAMCSGHFGNQSILIQRFVFTKVNKIVRFWITKFALCSSFNRCPPVHCVMCTYVSHCMHCVSHTTPYLIMWMPSNALHILCVLVEDADTLEIFSFIQSYNTMIHYCCDQILSPQVQIMHLLISWITWTTLSIPQCHVEFTNKSVRNIILEIH